MKIEIVDFGLEQIPAAREIALADYRKEQVMVPDLPAVPDWPDLSGLAENGLGVAAYEGGQMAGFLCAVGPFNGAFRSTDAVGVFSPMHANGARGENRAEIYSRLYQAAAGKWAQAGAVSHAVCLYAHDEEGQRQFYELGFGLRCLDAVRELDKPDNRVQHEQTEPAQVQTECPAGYSFEELEPVRAGEVYGLNLMLDAHMAASPTFILRQPETKQEFIEQAGKPETHIFAAFADGGPAAYLITSRDGETFICSDSDYLHITGAFCLPDHRGGGLYPALLAFAQRRIQEAGYRRLGVDFESINPAAHRFWRKHFGIYTRSLVRRIDEHAVFALHTKNDGGSI